MTLRIGQLPSMARINRDYPHQVALPPLNESEDPGRAERIVIYFQAHRISPSPRGFGVQLGEQQWDVYCFAKQDEADAFRVAFGGSWCPPSERGRRGNWYLWEPGEPLLGR
jgi:hypothetical protein